MQTPDRLHGLDAVRAFSLLSGIILHATISYFQPLPVADTSQSVALGLTFYLLHMFRLITFFLIAGFFGRMIIERQGIKGFIKDRSKRILLPMVAGWLLLSPIIIGAFIWGGMQTYRVGLVMSTVIAKAAATTPIITQPIASGGLPLLHLWFLYYLLIFYILALVIRLTLIAYFDVSGKLCTRIDAIVQFAMRSDIAPFLLATPICIVLYLTPTWPVWLGMPIPNHGFTPNLPALLVYGTAFAFGWLLHRQMNLLALFEKRYVTLLLMAVALSCICLMIAGITPNSLASLFKLPGTTWVRFAYIASYSLAAWFWTFSFIGLAMRFMSNKNASRRYLADASYWLYLIHVPIILLLQIETAQWALSWMVKFPLILSITLTIGLGTYHSMVRYTVIGAILNGKRYRVKDKMAVTIQPIEALDQKA